MENVQVNEKVKNAVDRINKILTEENIMLIPVTTIVNGQLAQRVEVVEKPAQPAQPAVAEEKTEAVEEKEA
jgi:uncharacterized protein YqgV (UPF0045/DUF77 family)